MKKLFISSASKGETGRYRSIATIVCGEYPEIEPIVQEGWTEAIPDTSWAVCKRYLQDVDGVLLILGKSYGSRPPDEERSYTELEFEYAMSHDIPVYPMIAEKSIRWPSDEIERQSKADRRAQKRFIEKVSSRYAKMFGDEAEFETKLRQIFNSFVRPSSPPERTTDVSSGIMVKPIARLKFVSSAAQVDIAGIVELRPDGDRILRTSLSTGRSRAFSVPLVTSAVRIDPTSDTLAAFGGGGLATVRLDDQARPGERWTAVREGSEGAFTALHCLRRLRPGVELVVDQDGAACLAKVDAGGSVRRAPLPESALVGAAFFADAPVLITRDGRMVDMGASDCLEKLTRMTGWVAVDSLVCGRGAMVVALQQTSAGAVVHVRGPGIERTAEITEGADAVRFVRQGTAGDDPPLVLVASDGTAGVWPLDSFPTVSTR